MKHLALFLLILSLSFCKSTAVKIDKQVSQQQERTEENYTINEKMEIIPRQIIKIDKDEAGIDYLKLLPGDKTVFKYSYKKKINDKTLMDAGYTQNIYFEIDGDVKNLDLKDDELKKVNLIAQIYGFRNAVLLPVDKGSVSIKIIDDKTIELEIHIDDSYKNILQKNIKQLIKV